MIEKSDAFLSLPGGLGTLDELFEVWTTATLGLHGKPIVLLDVDGFYTGLVAGSVGLAGPGFVRPGALAMLDRRRLGSGGAGRRRARRAVAARHRQAVPLGGPVTTDDPGLSTRAARRAGRSRDRCAPGRPGAAARRGAHRRAAAGHRRPRHRQDRRPWSRPSPPGWPRAPTRSGSWCSRSAGAAPRALRDRIEARHRRAARHARAEPLVRTFHGVRVRPAAARGRAGAASRRPGCSPAPSRTWSSASCSTPATTRTGRLAGVAAAGAAHPGVRRPSCATCCCAPPSAASARPAWPRLGRAAAAGRTGPAAARFFEEYAAGPRAARRHHPGLRRLRPGRAGPGRDRAARRRPGAARRRAAAGSTYVYVDELADTDPAQLDLLDLSPAAARTWSRSPTRTRRRSRSAAPTRPASATSRTGSAPPPARRAARSRSPRVVPVGAGAARGDPPGRGPAARPGRGTAIGRRPRRRASDAAAPVRGRARSGRRPARRRTWRTGCARRTCSTACRGRGWRCWCARPRRQLAPLQRALHQAGVPTVTHAEDLPLPRSRRSRRCCCCCAARSSRTGSTRRPRSALLHSPLGGADPLAERRLRQGLRALALAARRPAAVR